MLLAAQPYVDSAISKTVNIGDDITFDEFRNVYMKGWKGKAKGITTYRPAGKRNAILVSRDNTENDEGAACFINPESGQAECS